MTTDSPFSIAFLLQGRASEDGDRGRPLGVTFSSLLDCNEPDLKIGKIRYRSRLRLA